MAKTRKQVSPANKRVGKAVSAVSGGIHTARDIANVLAGMIEDLLLDRIPTATANSISSASGKLLKIAELQHRYSKHNTTKTVLRLAD